MMTSTPGAQGGACSSLPAAGEQRRCAETYGMCLCSLGCSHGVPILDWHRLGPHMKLVTVASLQPLDKLLGF